MVKTFIRNDPHCVSPARKNPPSWALRRSAEALSADDFPGQLLDLLGFCTGAVSTLPALALCRWPAPRS